MPLLAKDLKDNMIRRLFKLKEAGTTIPAEIMGGLTTFMTLSYIIFVQPAVLSTTGMDFGSVMVATCIGSAIACIFMAFLANYPIALAPAMGHNFYFAFTICGATAMGGLGYPWQVALGANFLSGMLFIFLSIFRFRETIINAIPDSLKHAISVGIGLLITLVGLEWAGIVVGSPGTLVGLGNLKSTPVLVSVFGIMFVSVLIARGVRGAILWGILLTTVVGSLVGVVKYQGVASLPPSITPTFGKLDILGVFRQIDFITVIFVLFFLDLFDTVGTLVGVGTQAGFMKEGRLPRAGGALLSDAIGTVGGTVLGTSTITSYIESAAGVQAGARTGLANIVTALLLLGSLFFYPLAKMIGGGYEVTKGVYLYPVIAPALIIVGVYMMKGVKGIKWDEPTEAIPAFLALISMPVTFSITEGIAFGFISYALIKMLSGKYREVPTIVYIFAGLFIIRYAFLKG